MDLHELINLLTLSDTRRIGGWALILATFLPLILSFLITAIYRVTQRNQNFSVAFIHALFLFSLLSSFITLIIGNNVARAFGLFGALSLVRFRTALKSPLDAVYVFWALAVGMACGTEYYFGAIAVSLLAAVVMLGLHLCHYGEGRHSESIVKIFPEPAREREALLEVEKTMQRSARSYQKIHTLYQPEDQSRAHIFLLRLKKNKDGALLHQELESIPGISKILYLENEAFAY